MRLINSTTHELEEFSREIPKYAILSHTWEKKELSFQDIQRRDAKHIVEFAKVEACCSQAKLDGLHYVWIDTCCIDKTSSAELSEAINSMYRWYKEAQVCYAYLADVPSGVDLQSTDSPFAKSRWFTRGWTLQELIAPSSLVFYGKDWHEIGTKPSLQKLIWEITGIPINVLKFGYIEKVSVAQRMSWASKRQTTRVEDIAYCLMGLFGVNMPMLYGEGERAFERLQEEIIKTSDDHTLFAWTEPDNRRRITRGLLAESPAEFISSGDIICSEPALKSAPYSMTNKGLCIELPLFRINDQLNFAILNCHRSSNVESLGIFLKQLSSGKEEYFARTFTDSINAISKEKVDEFEQRTVYIIQKKRLEKDMSEEMQVMRSRHEEQIAELKLIREWIKHEEQSKIVKAEMEEGLRRQRTEHKKQLKIMKEEIEEGLRRQRIEHKEQLKKMKEEMRELTRLRIEEQLEAIKEEVEELTRLRIKHEEQLEAIKEEVEELTSLRIEREEQLKAIKEEMDEWLGSRRIELEEQQRTAKEEMERKIELKFRDYQDLWEKNQAQTLLRTA